MISIKGKEGRGHAMSVAKPATSLWIVQIRRNKKQRRTSRKTGSRKEGIASDTLRRRSMVKLTLVKNGTPMRRVLAQMKKKGWQTLSSNPPQCRGSSPTSSMIPSLPLVSWQRETRYICLMLILFIMMLMMNIA
jgi:hypothetical protein